MLSKVLCKTVRLRNAVSTAESCSSRRKYSYVYLRKDIDKEKISKHVDNKS